MGRFTVFTHLILTLAAAGILAGCAATPEPEPPKLIAYPGPPDPARFFYERTLIGTASSRQVTQRDRLKVLLTGTATTEGEAFSKPFDIATHRGRVYITDTVARVVYALDFATQRSFVVGAESGPGELAKPLGIATDAQGNIYVVDTTPRTIRVYDRDGQHLRNIGDSTEMSRPTGIAVNKAGTRLYIVDTGGVDRYDEHRIIVMDAQTGEHLYYIGKRGKKDGEFNLARDVALSPDDRVLYVSDGGNFRVQAFTVEGKFIRKWGQPGRRLGQFTRAKGIAVDPDGNVYVSDAAFGNFQIFNPQGQLLMFIGARGTRGDPGVYMLPAGIDVDQDGRVLFVDQFFKKIDVFRPAAIAAGDGHLGQSPTPPKK